MKIKYTIEEVRPFIEQFVKINEIDYCGSGNHCDAFCVNGKFVFKFPKHRKANDCLKNEILLLKRLQNIFQIEIPNVVFEGKFMTGNNEFTFFASKKLNGKNLTKTEFLTLEHDELEKAAIVIAKFMKKLHSMIEIKKRKDCVLLHGDLSLNHVLFQNNEISGILDFADSRTGKYKSDFIYLLDDKDPEEFGGKFGKMVLEYYLQLKTLDL